MILDGYLKFSAAQDLAQVVGDYASSNILDLHMAGIPVLAANQGARDMGIGDDPALKIFCAVGVAFTSGGAGTLQVTLQGAADDGAGAPTTWFSWWSSPAYALATLNAGSKLFSMDMPRPPDGISIPRFLRLLYSIGGATMTAGQLNSYLVLDRPDQPYLSTDNSILGGYPAGINVAN